MKQGNLPKQGYKLISMCMQGVENGIAYSCSDCLPLSKVRWIINYRKILKRYLFKTHDRWHECYSINKTSIRKNYSGVTEIVELKSK